MNEVLDGEAMALPNIKHFLMMKFHSSFLHTSVV